MNQLLAVALAVVLLPVGALGQQPSRDERDVPGVSSQAWFTAGVAYPLTTTGGIAVVMGKRRLGGIPGRGSTIRGLAAAADIGPGGVSGRIGWSKLFEYDAGVDGWSFDAVYVRPWWIEWGSSNHANYVGAGLTRYGGFLRLSGAVVVNTSTNRDVSSTVTLGLLFPL